MHIGYNVNKAKELMENIAKAYEDMGVYTKDQWEGVYKALQTNWVGEDEQDFESKLAKRICDLYVNAYNLAQSSITTIEGLVNAWHEFQQKNTLTGDASAGNKGGFLGFGGNKFSIDAPTIKKEDKIVEAHLVQLDNNTNRGLKDAASKSNIKSSVDTFVGQIKAKTNTLFDEIQTNQAFFGEQTSTIKSYVTKVGDAIAEVTIAIKDMYSALDQLVGTSYSTAQTDIKSQFTKASGSVDQSLNDLGSSRWS